jgi:hypothetical protein
VTRHALIIAATLTGAVVLSFPAASGRENGPAPRAETNLTASVSQGFNFQKDAQEIVGHINALKIGDKELTADLAVTDPMNVAKTLKVVGVASGIQWKGGYADPITFSAQVSTASKNVFATLVHKTLTNTEVKFAFTFYAYDTKAKQYYQVFHSGGATLEGLVLKRGGELAMQVNMDASAEVPSPKNYSFSLGVMPQDRAMMVQLAVSATDKYSKPWGVEVAK